MKSDGPCLLRRPRSEIAATQITHSGHPPPERFGSIEDARAFLRCFFDWYNNEHRHSGIGLVTPAQRHSGKDKIVYKERQVVLKDFYERHPERFVRGVPKPPALPGEVWINKPEQVEIAA